MHPVAKCSCHFSVYDACDLPGTFGKGGKGGWRHYAGALVVGAKLAPGPPTAAKPEVAGPKATYWISSGVE